MTAEAHEYENAREGAALCDLGDRGLLAVSGPLRQKFLQGLLSNDILSRAPGAGCRAALMDAKGHLAALMRVLVLDSEIVLELPPGTLAGIERVLTHYRVAAPVRFAPASDVVIGLLGPHVLPRLRALGAETADLAPEAHAKVTVAGTPVRLVRAGDLPAQGHVIHAPRESAAALRSSLAGAGFVTVAPRTLDALRVEEGRAWYGIDVSERNLLHETGLVSEYHSPTKGCYVGQEVVARLAARGGNVSQRLCGLRLSAPRPAGTILLGGDQKEVGTLTTASVSPAFGPIAMGYVHRSQAEPGTALEADGARAEVAALPLKP